MKDHIVPSDFNNDMGIHHTPYKQMNKNKTPEEKLFEFAENCPNFSLNCDDLFVLAGLEKHANLITKDLIVAKGSIEANKSIMAGKIEEAKNYLATIKSLQEDFEKSSSKTKDNIIEEIKKFRQKLNVIEKETYISISEESSEEKTKASSIGQLEL